MATEGRLTRRASKTKEEDQMSVINDTIQRGLEKLETNFEQLKIDLRQDLVSVISTTISEAIQKELSVLRLQVEQQRKEIDLLKKAFLDSENTKLTEKRRELESNIIIRGVNEDSGETTEQTHQKVTNLLRSAVPNLLPLKSFRIGRAVNGKPKPIKVMLKSKGVQELER